jgi:protease I
MKKILLIVASENFKDEEYFVTKEVLEDSGFYVEIASNVSETAFGSDGGEARIDLTLDEVNINNYEGVFFIGGSGALQYLDNETSYGIARKIISAKKVLGAICIAPVILAKAGILKNRKATVWTSPLDKSPVKILKQYNVQFINEPVVQDGKIITGNGPRATKEFAEKIVEMLINQRLAEAKPLNKAFE